MMLKLKTNDAPFVVVVAFLSLLSFKSIASGNWVYEEHPLDRIQHVQASHGQTLRCLDGAEVGVLALDMPGAILLTRVAAVIDGFRTDVVLQDCAELTHDNLSLLLMRHRGELCCLSLESLCAAGYVWTEEPVFLIAALSLSTLRNLVSFLK